MLLGIGSIMPVAAQQKPNSAGVNFRTAAGKYMASYATYQANSLVLENVTFVSAKKDKSGHKFVWHARRLTLTPIPPMTH